MISPFDFSCKICKQFQHLHRASSLLQNILTSFKRSSLQTRKSVAFGNGWFYGLLIFPWVGFVGNFISILTLIFYVNLANLIDKIFVLFGSVGLLLFPQIKDLIHNFVRKKGLLTFWQNSSYFCYAARTRSAGLRNNSWTERCMRARMLIFLPLLP